MSLRLRFAGGLLLILSLACGGGSPSAPIPPPQLSFAPADLTSAWGAPLHVHIYNRHGLDAVGLDRLQEVASKVKLVSWPSRMAIEFTTVITDFVPERVPGVGDKSGPGIVEVRPTTPLGSGWFALLMDGLPADIRVVDTDGVGRSGTAFLSRFSVSPDPRLSRVQRCIGLRVNGPVLLEFTEPLMATGIERVVVMSGANPCPIRAPEAQTGTRGIRANCDAIDRERPIDIDLPQLFSLSGLPVKGTSTHLSLPPERFNIPSECDIAVVDPSL